MVFNINKGHCVEIVKQSPLLCDYIAFVEEVREIGKKEGMTPERVMERAVENCIKKGILTNFLTHHKTEVMKMLVTEWDYDLEKEVIRDEAREDERHKIIKDFYRIGVGIETIAKAVDRSEQEVKKILGL
jgi:hypothetical protein